MGIEEVLSLKKKLFETIKEEMKRYPDDMTLSDYYKKTCSIFSSEDSVDKDEVNEVIDNVLSSVNAEVCDDEDYDQDRVDLNLDSEKNANHSTPGQVNLDSDEVFPECMEADNPLPNLGSVEADLNMDVVVNKVGSKTNEKNQDMPTFSSGISQTPTPPNEPEPFVVSETNEKNDNVGDQVCMDVVNDGISNHDVLNAAVDMNDLLDAAVDVDKVGKVNDNVNDIVTEENVVVDKNFVVDKVSVVEKSNDVVMEEGVVANVGEKEKNKDSVNEDTGMIFTMKIVSIYDFSVADWLCVILL